jgi:type I restriction enzyme S subunit
MESKNEDHSFTELIDAGILEIGDGYRAKNSELGGDGLIFLRSGHVRDTHIDFTGVERFHRDLTVKVMSKSSRVGDVILTTKGNSTGRSSYVSQSMPRFVYSPHLSYWRSLRHDILWPDFLRFWVQGGTFKHQLSGLAASTDMAPYLSLIDQKRLRIVLPPVDEQISIASVLSALDDTIASFRVTNETLEALAGTIFKSWFVDFDPVRAKAEGREPEGMDAATAAHFPGEFQQSELGLIPYGWRADFIGEFAEIVGGSTPSTANFANWQDGEHFWATPKDLSANPSPILLATERRVTDQGLASIGSGLLPVGSVLLSSRAPIGYLALTQVPTAINQGFIAMKPLECTSNVFLLLWTEHAMETIRSLANGSTFQEISKRNFRTIRLVHPDKGVLSAFDSIVQPMYERITANAKQVQTLSELRDTLLPRLISGKLRVPDAEELVEAVL